MSQFESHQREGISSYSRSSAFLFYTGPQLIRRGSPTLGRTICFTQSTKLNVTLTPKHPCRNTQNNVSPNIWAPQGPVKLTHKTNHC